MAPSHTTRMTCPLRFPLAVGLLAASLLLSGCHTNEPTPPPEARRPELRTEQMLVAAREERIRRGEITPAGDAHTQRQAPATRGQAPTVAAPGAIEGEVLIVNDAVITVSEVLYPLRDRLAELRRTRTAIGFAEEARTLIRREAQEEIGRLLIYREAHGQLDEQRRRAFDFAVDRETDAIIARDFGGSQARFDDHLRQYGLTRELWRGALLRRLLVQQYTREKLMPQVQVRRDDLLGHYQANLPRYTASETRELLVIELPFGAFLPEGQVWATAGERERAAAQLRATRAAREAHAALAERAFAEVAAEFSRSPKAAAGGSWGRIGRPLQAPFDQLSTPIFHFAEGQYSDVLELPDGLYIAACGAIEPATRRDFREVQEEIRRELMENRFQRLSVTYIMRLAEHATISALQPFVEAALRHAQQPAFAAVQP